LKQQQNVWKLVFSLLIFLSFFDILAHTVAKRIMEDIEQGHLTNLHDVKSGGDGLISLANSRHIRTISYEDWKRLDAHETNLGLAKGKPREKILNIEEMLKLTSSTKS
jgi:adrenodoxin-NADP+ reductase